MDYLPSKDRRQTALVNKKWYNASLHPKLIKKDWVIFGSRKMHLKYNHTYEIDERLHFDNFTKLFLNSERVYLNLKIQYPIFINPVNIFQDFSYKIVSLKLTNIPCFIYLDINSIINKCLNLESLELKKVFKITITDGNIRLKMHSIKFNNVNITDYSFNMIMKYFPNIENFELNNCWIVESELCNSEKVMFTVKNIINYFKTTTNINNLTLQNYIIFMHLPSHIKLKYLTLENHRPKYFYTNSHNDLTKLSLQLKLHTSLHQLTLKMFPCCLLSVVSNLFNLKQLEVHFTVDDSNVCNVIKLCLKTFIESLTNMKKLSKLSITPWSPDKVLIYSDTVPNIPKNILNVLTSLDCHIENGLQIAHFNKDLKYLRIQNGNVLTANDLHFIFNNLINLRTLCIEKCDVFNDDILSELPISNLKGKII